MGHARPLFHLFSSFLQTLQFLQQQYVKNTIASQYKAPGFEPKTFGTRVSSLNYLTRGPALVSTTISLLK